MLASTAIVVEWETVLAGGYERAVRGLRAINRQLWALEASFTAPPEVIVCFEAAEASEASVRSALATADEGRGWPGTLRIAGAPDRLDYYQKKNFGFSLSTNEIVVFVDSDLVPEPEWLEGLVAAFADFNTSVVVGRTHLETGSIYERAVALFWIFDARDGSSVLRQTRRLISNNVAFRRPLFARLPFPVGPSFRGLCSELASMLTARGVPMHEHTGARACHPAPDGPRQFFTRALHAGADQYFYDALAAPAGLERCAGQWATDVRRVVRRAAERRAAIGAGIPSVAVALLLGLAFYSTKAAGYIDALRRRPHPKVPDSSSHSA